MTEEDIFDTVAESAYRDWPPDTPLHEAARRSTTAAPIEALLVAGADPNAPGYHDSTPLHIAVFGGRNSWAVVWTLINAGADLEAREIYGKTPLIRAAAYNETSLMTEVLIDAGAEVGVRDEYGMTPLHWAARSGKASDIMPTLLDAGADPNARDKIDRTPLHLTAVVFGESSAAVAKLIEAGADPEVREQEGLTPAEYAFRYSIDWTTSNVLHRRGAAPPRGIET